MPRSLYDNVTTQGVKCRFPSGPYPRLRRCAAVLNACHTLPHPLRLPTASSNVVHRKAKRSHLSRAGLDLESLGSPKSISIDPCGSVATGTRLPSYILSSPGREVEPFPPDLVLPHGRRAALVLWGRDFCSAAGAMDPDLAVANYHGGWWRVVVMVMRSCRGLKVRSA